MRVAVAIAGVITVALGIGHETLGRLRVLPKIGAQKSTSSSAAVSGVMIRVTWHIVTLFALASGGLLISLAWAPDIDAQTVVLRWFAGMWLAAAAMAFAVVGPRRVLRLPVPLLWIVVGVLCWVGST